VRKKELEIELQRTEGFSDPSPELEQYTTPAPIAAEVLHLAHARGELQGRVADLGCGTGIFAIGAALLGADALGVDLDPSALKNAQRNARDLGTEPQFIRSDVEHLELKADLVVQNPPFGSQNPGADRPFVKKALETAPTAYSLHNAATRGFVEKYAKTHGGEARLEGSYRFPLPNTQAFHTEEKKTITVDLYRLKTR